MSAEEFIAELQRRGLLNDRQVERLRQTLSRKAFATSAVAEFLVQKGLVSQQLAFEISNGAAPRTAPGGVPDVTSSSIDLAQMVEADLAQTGGSSVFDSHAMHFPPRQEPSESDDELELAPLDDDGPIQQMGRDELMPAVEEPEPVTLQPIVDKRGPRLVARPLAGPSIEARLAEMPQKTGPAPGAKGAAATSKTAKKPLKKTKPFAKKHWDSPLILLGGGGLILLLVCGGAVWWLMNRESSDQQLAAAPALDSGAYPQAIERYQAFLDGTTRHPERSRARVQLAMVRIRQKVESGDFSGALTTAQEELKGVEDEADVKDAYGELASLLPQIAFGLADKAEQVGSLSDDTTRLVAEANQAIELANNVEYVPKNLRDEGKLTTVRETLARVESRRRTHIALSAGLAEIEKTRAAGKPVEAYSAHTKLLREHPELAGNPKLTEAIKKTTSLEQAQVQFVAEQQDAETQERPTPWLAALTVANRRVLAKAGVAGAPETVCVRIQGAVYGLEVASGRVLWRRAVGGTAALAPLVVGEDVLVVDSTHQELLRLNATSGKLVWRQGMGGRFAQPLVAGDQIYVSAESGRLFVIELSSGKRLGFVQFAQPLRVAPATDRQVQRLYIAGDQAALYSLSLADFKCLGVYYLGNSPGSIRAPCAQISNKVVVIENDGVETSRMRLLSLDSNGTITKQDAERRLTGLVMTSPIMVGRALIVTTDRGQIDVYDIGAGDAKDPLKLVATREAVGSQPLIRHVALVGRNLWAGDTQLTKYSIVPAGNRLPVEEIMDNFAGATFDHPLTAIGTTLVDVHRPAGRPGFVVAAIDTAAGRALWQTDLAVPPAGAPIVETDSKAIVAANTAGSIFRLDEALMRARLVDQPMVAQSAPAEPPVLATSVELGQGRAVFSAAGSANLLHYNSSLGANSAKWVTLEGPLACPVTALGDVFVAPLSIGQVFYLNSSDATRAATPFQPLIQPRSTTEYQSATPVGGDGTKFVISDGRDSAYLVSVVNQPQPHLEKVVEANVGPIPLSTPMIAIGETAMAVAGDMQLVRFELPTLAPAGETKLKAPAIWGPFAVGDVGVLATADGQLMAVSASGEIKWTVAAENGDLVGRPLVVGKSLLLSYRKGVVERRSIADGKSQGVVDLEQPLETGPVRFLQRMVVTASDGTLLIFNQP